jgi:hypothetical protein
VPEGDPQDEEPQETPLEDLLEAGMEFSPQPNQGAARGRRDKVTPARGGGMNWTREMNLKEAQI